MSTILCIILFILFAAVQFILSKRVSNRIARCIPLIVSAMVTIFAVGLHIYANISIWRSKVYACPKKMN